MAHRGSMRKFVLAVALAFTGFAAFSAAKPAGQIPKEPIKWSMQVSLPEGPVKPEDKFTIQLTAKIEEGWHLYSPDQEEGGPLPTRISLTADQNFEPAGAMESSEPKTAMDPNFNLMTRYYEEQAVFVIPVKVSAKAAAGKNEVKASVNFQTCNDELCLPPKTVKLSATVNVSR